MPWCSSSQRSAYSVRSVEESSFARGKLVRNVALSDTFIPAATPLVVLAELHHGIERRNTMTALTHGRSHLLLYSQPAAKGGSHLGNGVVYVELAVFSKPTSGAEVDVATVLQA